MKYLLFIFFLSCTAEVQSDSYIDIKPIPENVMNQKEQDMTNIILGIRHLETSMILYNQATVKAQQMSDDGFASHSGYMQDAINSGASHYGQSVSYGYITSQSNVTAFYNSEPHRDMMNNPNYDKIAVACNGLYTVVLLASWNKSNKMVVVELVEVSR